MPGYDEALRENADLAVMVTHPDDDSCPGHDINPVLIAKSREMGFCLCIHPFMQVIDFTGMGCSWCDQRVTDESSGPLAKDIRTKAVHDALGPGPGACTGQS